MCRITFSGIFPLVRMEIKNGKEAKKFISGIVGLMTVIAQQ